MSIVLSSDWQLQERAWRARVDLRCDSYFGLEQVVNYCVEHNLPLLALGDLTDSDRPDATTVNVLSKQLRRMEDSQLSVWYVLGNHDPATHLGGNWISTVSPTWAIHLYPGEHFLYDNFVLSGTDYVSPSRFQQLIPHLSVAKKERPGWKHILATHQMWRGLGNHTANQGCCFEWLDDTGVDLLATGDLHETVIRDVGKLRVVSPGSLCMQSIDEPEQKNFLVVHDDLSIETIPLHARNVVRLQIGCKEQLSEFLDLMPKFLAPNSAVPPELQKPILDVYLLAEVPNVRRLLEHAVGGRGHLFFRNRFDTAQTVTAQAVVKEGRAAGSSDLAEALAQELRDNLGDAPTVDEIRAAERRLHIGTALLRSAGNPDEVLDGLEHELFQGRHP